MTPTKLQSLLRNVKKMSDRDYGTIEKFKRAVYEFGHECFIKSLQGKLLEVKYDGTIVDVDTKEELK